jgi:hypothetical protein
MELLLEPELELDNDPTSADDDCVVCMGLHEDEIHAATMGIRGWHLLELERRIARPPVLEVTYLKTESNGNWHGPS